MCSPPKLQLVDRCGNPLNSRIRAALDAFVWRFRRRFLSIRDEAVIANLFEEAGRRIDDKERADGHLENLHGFAWTTLEHLAISWMRRPEQRLQIQSVSITESDGRASSLAAQEGSPEQLEDSIFWRELLETMNETERLAHVWRIVGGFSNREIAKLLRRSPGSVDTMFSRTRARLRKMIAERTLRREV
jgi:RNA polymerase sigma factor (sigma-70 family)